MYNRSDKRVSNAVNGVKELNRNTRRQPSDDMTEAIPSTSSASSSLPKISDERVESPSEASENHPDRSAFAEYVIMSMVEPIPDYIEYLLKTHNTHYVERVVFELLLEIERLQLNFLNIDEHLPKEFIQEMLEKYKQAAQDPGSSERSQSGDDASLGLNRMDGHNWRTRFRTDPAFTQIQMRHLNHSETSSSNNSPNQDDLIANCRLVFPKNPYTSSLQHRMGVSNMIVMLDKITLGERKDRGDQQDENINNNCRTILSAPIEEPYDDNRFSAKASRKKTQRKPFYIRDQAGRKRGQFSRSESTSSRSLHEEQSSISVLRRKRQRKNKTTFRNLHDTSTENSEDSSDEVQDGRRKRS